MGGTAGGFAVWPGGRSKSRLGGEFAGRPAGRPGGRTGGEFAGQPKGRTGGESAGRPRRSAAERARRTVVLHRWMRYAVQIVFLVLAPGVWNSAWSGVKYVFSQLGGLEAIELSSFVVTLLCLLAFTVLFGRFFCGWACAFGTLGDVVWGVVDFTLRKLGLPHPQIPERVMGVLAWVKYAVLVAVCAMCLLGVWSSVLPWSPWVAFAAFTSGSFGGTSPVAYAVLGAVVVGMALSERFFCRVLCPMGAVFSLMPTLPVTSFTRNRDHCARKCGRCRSVCPVGIWPDADSLAHGECISCGRCADVCPMHNVNFAAVEKQGTRGLGGSCGSGGGRGSGGSRGSGDGRGSGGRAAEVIGEEMLACGGARPTLKTREGWWLARGSGVASILVRALLLFALVWALGSVRYLPACPWGV